MKKQTCISFKGQPVRSICVRNDNVIYNDTDTSIVKRKVYYSTKNCYIFNKPVNNPRVMDHDHITGRIHGHYGAPHILLGCWHPTVFLLMSFSLNDSLLFHRGHYFLLRNRTVKSFGQLPYLRAVIFARNNLCQTFFENKM